MPIEEEADESDEIPVPGQVSGVWALGPVPRPPAMLGADYWQHLEKEHGMARSIAVRHMGTER